MHKQVKYFIPFFLLCLFGTALVTPAYAGGCGCGSVRMIVSQAHTQTVTKINTHVSAEARSIENQILIAATNITGSNRTNTNAIISAINAQTTALVNNSKEVLKTAESAKSLDSYGMKRGQPTVNCDNATLGGGVQTASIAEVDTHKGLQKHTTDHSQRFEKSHEFVEYWADEEQRPTEEEAVSSVFPPNSTLTKQQITDSADTTNLLTNALPPPTIEDPMKKTEAGKAYSFLRKRSETRKAVVADALNQNMLYRSPLLPEEVTKWAKDQWQKAGAKGEPTGIVEGKLSFSALFKLLSQIRLGNPHWYKDVISLSQEGLMREQVTMQAILLEQNRQILEQLHTLNVIMATNTSILADQTVNKETEKAYEIAIGASFEK